MTDTIQPQTRPTLRQSTGPAHTRILAYGAARGEVAVPNEDLVEAIGNPRVGPVKIWLRGVKEVEVPRAGCAVRLGDAGPCRPAKC